MRYLRFYVYWPWFTDKQLVYDKELNIKLIKMEDKGPLRAIIISFSLMLFLFHFADLLFFHVRH
jgi:hypothetical protein